MTSLDPALIKSSFELSNHFKENARHLSNIDLLNLSVYFLNLLIIRKQRGLV